MFSNYFKVLLRNLRKNKFFSGVNIFGLSVGLACCLLIALFVAEETNYDRHHPRVVDLYRLGSVLTKLDNPEDEAYGPRFYTPSPLAEMLPREIPEIEKMARTMAHSATDRTLIRSVENGVIGDKASNELGAYFADSTLFELFAYDFTEGNPIQALNAPGTVVLTEALARKFFGDQPAYGRTLRISNADWFPGGELDFRVTGVVREPTAPTHLRDARFFMSLYTGDMGAFIRDNQDLANNSIFSTYLRLRPGADARAVEAKIVDFDQKHVGAEARSRGFANRPFLVAVPDVHLSGIIGPGPKGGSRTYLYILGSIALFTLLIACVNFMNLSTARSARRAGEVGVRKAMGANKRKLIEQFLGESVAIALVAFVFALVLARVGLPWFNRLADRELAFSPGSSPGLFAGFLALAVGTGVLAGLYPAFFLASFRPVEVLKGKLANNLSAAFLRQGLVVFQFVISAGLILASLVIRQQMHYLESKDLGFRKEQQIVIPLQSAAAVAAYPALKRALDGDSRIARSGASLTYPGAGSAGDWLLHRYGQPTDQTVDVLMNTVDDGFMPALELEPVAGRVFSYAYSTDSLRRMILNETAVRRFGFASPQEAIGQALGFKWGDSLYRYEILGVVRDFHVEDLHRPIQPVAFRLARRPNFRYLIARAGTGELQPLLTALEASWKQFVPGEPFRYSFLDEDFRKNYEADRRTAGLVGTFTGIAIVISCLGLFGLATFAAERRTREIGIRKVLGASVAGITGLLARDFLQLVVLGIVIASPIAWWVMRGWLDDFAYRIEISWWMFAAAGAVAMAIAFLTVGYQSIKAAMGNPVRALKSE
jgi:putative ABC transport system permease protein